MFHMQFRCTETPYGDKRLQEIDRHQCQCPGTHIFFENASGEIAQQDEQIDENNGE